MRAVISSRKHYVQFTEFTVASATVTSHTYVQGVNPSAVNANFEVEEGSIVKAIYLEYWLQGDETAVGSFVFTVEKQQASIGPPTFSQMTTLDAYPNKKNVLFTSQGLIAAGSGSSSGNPSPILRQWIKIPKGKQRFGLQDKIIVNIAALGASAIVGCAFGTYKDYN